MTDYPAFVHAEALTDPAARTASRAALDAHYHHPNEPPLPAKFTQVFPHQWDAVQEAITALSQAPVAFLDAPTGSGKSLMAELVRRELGVTALYSCTTKSLQSQLEAEFSYAKVIKGRANYPTLDDPNMFPEISAELCDRKEGRCRWCSTPLLCPYEVAKAEAVVARLAVANTSYLLREWAIPITAWSGSQFTGRPLVIIDECDRLVDNITGYVEVTLSKRVMKENYLEAPPKHSKWPERVEWLRRQAIPKVKSKRAQLGRGSMADPKHRKRYMAYVRLEEKLAKVAANDPETGEPVLGRDWVYDDFEQGRVTFKPVRAAEHAEEAVWRHGERFLLMSATIISAGQMARDLGLE